MPQRYRTANILQTEEGIRYFKNVVYPDIPVSEDDIYIITTGLDRYDTLALQFYKDSSLWWVIACANNANKDGLIVDQGVQLRIPASATQVIGLFEELNRKR